MLDDSAAFSLGRLKNRSHRQGFTSLHGPPLLCGESQVLQVQVYIIIHLQPGAPTTVLVYAMAKLLLYLETAHLTIREV